MAIRSFLGLATRRPLMMTSSIPERRKNRSLSPPPCLDETPALPLPIRPSSAMPAAPPAVDPTCTKIVFCFYDSEHAAEAEPAANVNRLPRDKSGVLGQKE